MEIVREPFGSLPDGRQVERITLKNSRGMQAEIMTYGAALIRLLVPDDAGEVRDVVLGYDSLEGYLRGDSYQGAVVGRYANRIAGGSYTHRGKQYNLTKNENGRTTLHGGANGFDKKVWSVSNVQQGEDPSVTFFCHSADGEEGFPGNMGVSVRYTLREDNTLILDYRAVADQDTPVNLTNHAYFNLAGFDAGSVESHVLQLDAAYFTPADENSIPTGEILPVRGTPMDFTKPKAVGREIGADYAPLKLANGYDHNFVLDEKEGCARFAELYDPETGRAMEVSTNLPGVQIYTANFLKAEEAGKNGVHFAPRCAICLETQYFPDSMHHSEFPSPIVEAGEEYRACTTYRFYQKDRLAFSQTDA